MDNDDRVDDGTARDAVAGAKGKERDEEPNTIVEAEEE